MQKLKILVVSGTPPPYSGPEIMTAHLLNSSLNEQYELIHFNISKGRGVNEKARFDLFNVMYGLLQPLQLIWLLIYHHPDLVYTNLAQNLGGFLRYASFILPTALFRVPIVVRTMGDGFNHFYYHANKPLKWLIQIVLNSVACFIVRADRLKAQYEGLVPPEKIQTVYSGINVSEFNCARFRDDDGTARILFVGYLTKAKGAHDLLEAVPLVAPKYPNVCFQLMGERVDVERNITYIDNPESNSQQLDALLSRPEIASHVELLGVLAGEDKANAFCNADLFVFPSYSEAFPTVILEAMAASLPIVATPTGALPEVFTQGEITFVEPGNIEQLATAINTYIAQPQLRKQQGNANRIVAETQFDTDAHACTMGKVFQTYLAKK